MAVFIVLWPYLLTSKLRSVIRHNLGHSNVHCTYVCTYNRPQEYLVAYSTSPPEYDLFTKAKKILKNLQMVNKQSCSKMNDFHDFREKKNTLFTCFDTFS